MYTHVYVYICVRVCVCVCVCVCVKITMITEEILKKGEIIKENIKKRGIKFKIQNKS